MLRDLPAALFLPLLTWLGPSAGMLDWPPLIRHGGVLSTTANPIDGPDSTVKPAFAGALAYPEFRRSW